MTAAEKRITDLEARMDEAERQIKALWEYARENRSRIEYLEGKMEKVEEDIEEIKDRLDAMPVTITLNADNRIVDTGHPDAPGEVLLGSDSIMSDSGKSDVVVRHKNVIIFVVNPCNTITFYVNWLAAAYNDNGAPNEQLNGTVTKIAVNGVDMTASAQFMSGYVGSPYGNIPYGWGQARINVAGMGQVYVRCDSEWAVGCTNFDPTIWPNNNIPFIVQNLTYSQPNVPKLFHSAQDYWNSIVCT